MCCKDVDKMCDFRGLEMESLHHLLWSCIATKLVLEKVFCASYMRYMAQDYMNGGQ